MNLMAEVYPPTFLEFLQEADPLMNKPNTISQKLKLAFHLQKALIKLGQSVSLDYNVGLATIKSTFNVDADALKTYFLNEREAHYRRLVDLYSSQSIFLLGWLNRINRLRNEPN